MLWKPKSKNCSMNKNLTALFVVLPVLSLFFMRCGSASKITGYRVEVHAPSSVYKSLLLKRLNAKGELSVLDTLALTDGKAVYSHQLSSSDVYFISNGSDNILFFLEPADIKVYIDSASFKADSIVGGKENARYAQFVNTIDSLKNVQKQTLGLMAKSDKEKRQQAQEKLFALSEEMKSRAYRFASSPSLAGIAVMTEITFGNDADIKKLTEIYQSYPESLRKTHAGKFLTKRLNELSVGAVGMRAQNFTAPDPEGKLISLYSVMGKVTVVDFWAAWCKPCRVENPNLVRIYNKYHDQGLNIIGVSLDRNKEAWLKAIEQDGLKWYQVSHLKGWQEPVAKQYKVTFIPQNLVIDKRGIVRYKNLRGKLLEEKVRELLDE